MVGVSHLSLALLLAPLLHSLTLALPAAILHCPALGLECLSAVRANPIQLTHTQYIMRQLAFVKRIS
jgi:hypothetical protein